MSVKNVNNALIANILHFNIYILILSVANMCLTIPKKVLYIKGDKIIVETYDGPRQEVKSIVDLKIGDYVLTQQNMVVEKINKREAEEVMKLFQNRKEKNERK